MQVPDLVNRPDLKYRPLRPACRYHWPKKNDLHWPPSARVMCCCIIHTPVVPAGD